MRSITKNYLICYLMSLVAFLGLMMLLTSCKKLFGPSDPMPTSFSYPPYIAQYTPPVFVTQSRAVFWVYIYTSGNNTSIFFDYGTTISYGNSIAGPRLTSTTAYGSTRSSAVTLTCLSPGTTYHYRFKAANKYGTTIGPDGLFTTLNEGESGIIFNPKLTYGTLTDVEGNTYKTIQIGTQTWMAENLKTTSFSDAIPITKVTDDKEWARLTTPAYCWYDNDSVTYNMSNGALYNWFAVNTGKLCPTGWHVPTDLEWTTLIYYLGGNDVALGKLQETGTTHWTNQNLNATNNSGFTALPCGSRQGDESAHIYADIGFLGNWWSSTKYPVASDIPLIGAWKLPLFYYPNQGSSTIYLNYGSYTYGLSIRCVKN